MLATFTHLLGPGKGECERFDADRILIGRAPDNQLRFGDAERRVSSHHAEVRREGGHYILRDLGSTNGTMINGRRVITSEIKADDLIEFGAGGPLVRFGVEGAEAAGSADGRGAQTDAELLRKSAVERIVGEALRGRAGNLRIIAAMTLAMIAGASGGIALSRRLAPSDSERLKVVEVAERNSAAVVFIRAEYELVDSSGQVIATEARSGSGFVVSRDGLIITNRHILRDWDYNAPPAGVTGRTTRVEVVFPGKRMEDAVRAEVWRLAQNKERDVAVLRIDPLPNLKPVHAVDDDLEHTKPGDKVLVIGYPLGTDLLQLTKEDRIAASVSTGEVSRVSPEVIQLNLRAYRGNSGGPVLNGEGEVIGILTANLAGAEGIALCIPVSAATELIKKENQR